MESETCDRGGRSWSSAGEANLRSAPALIETCTNVSGAVLWEGPYIFRRLSAVGDEIVRDSRRLRVLACRLERSRVLTVCQEMSA